ncbi:O-antigen ligase family protein [Psychroflexus sp. YR1-1]|uniref:O-antigen ligase family protein n=2 Tax=Psychroflexus aurantiacus TaxID=2709310 RepID=A0A6B3R603_9FLAO|nr:O-antigen ligase family protein [Psychroflexus aurantiacus]
MDQIQKQTYIRVNALMILIFSLGLWFSASKAIILATLALVIFYLISQSGISFKKAAIGLSVLVVFGISIATNPFLKQRFIEGFTYDINFEPTDKLENARVFTSAEIDEISDLELRVILGKISTYHLVKDQNLMFGYGLSDYQDYLDYYYMYYGLAPFHYEGYSPHNQYITTLVSSGLVGLFIFLLYIGYSFYRGFIKGHYLYLSFLILFCFAMVFETYLLRAKGIIFFFFFNSFFLIHNAQNTKDEDSNIRK